MADLTTELFRKAQQYVRSAAVLLELGDYDSCASRAYFAMFYATQALLLDTNGQLPTKQGIRSTFREQFVDTGELPERAADMLDRAYAVQEKADYSSRFATEADRAEQTLQEAEAFINAVRRHAGLLD